MEPHVDGHPRLLAYAAHAGWTLEGKVAVITGAGSGIGRACAVSLAAAGAAVVVNDIRCEMRSRRPSRRWQPQGGKAVGYTGDVRSLDDVRAIVDFAVDRRSGAST